VPEDPADHRRVLDARQHPDLPPALLAGGDLNAEHALEPLRLTTHAGFSLHAGVAVRGGDRKTLERLCRYLTRPALAEGRLSLTPQGRVRYTLKTPYRDGTTHVVFAPLDFIARLAALVPRPRVHLTRYHGEFAPHSAWRAQITPAGRGRGIKPADTRTPAERHRAMSWAQRLKRVFKLDLGSCEGCGGQVRVVACIEDPAVIGIRQPAGAFNELGAGFPANYRLQPLRPRRGCSPRWARWLALASAWSRPAFSPVQWDCHWWSTLATQ
jgi:hypothetical protein